MSIEVGHIVEICVVPASAEGHWQVAELYIYFTFLDLKGDRALLALVVPRHAETNSESHCPLSWPEVNVRNHLTHMPERKNPEHI